MQTNTKHLQLKLKTFASSLANVNNIGIYSVKFNNTAYLQNAIYLWKCIFIVVNFYHQNLMNLEILFKLSFKHQTNVSFQQNDQIKALFPNNTQHQINKKVARFLKKLPYTFQKSFS